MLRSAFTTLELFITGSTFISIQLQLSSHILNVDLLRQHVGDFNSHSVHFTMELDLLIQAIHVQRIYYLQRSRQNLLLYIQLQNILENIIYIIYKSEKNIPCKLKLSRSFRRFGAKYNTLKCLCCFIFLSKCITNILI